MFDLDACVFNNYKHGVGGVEGGMCQPSRLCSTHRRNVTITLTIQHVCRFGVARCGLDVGVPKLIAYRMNVRVLVGRLHNKHVQCEQN